MLPILNEWVKRGQQPLIRAKSRGASTSHQMQVASKAEAFVSSESVRSNDQDVVFPLIFGTQEICRRCYCVR